MAKEKVKITLEGHPEAIEGFMDWLSNSGEQDYWTALPMAMEECRASHGITCFDYDYKKKVITGEVKPIAYFEEEFPDDE